MSLLSLPHHNYHSLPPVSSLCRLHSNNSSLRSNNNANYSTTIYYSTRTTIGYNHLRHSLLAGESNIQHNNAAIVATTIIPKRPFSSSFLDKLKKQAESVAEKASKTAKKTAQTAAKKAQGLASEALESTKKVVQNAGDKTLQRVSETASNAKQKSTQTLSDATANLKKATSEALRSSVGGATKQLSEVASTAKKSTTETIVTSRKAIESGVEQQTKAAAQKVETIKEDATQKVETIKESSKQVTAGLLSTGTKALRWFWWWSLAAIFVYGLASNLPMAIIKYTIQNKPKPSKGNSGEDDDKQVQQEQGESTIRTDDVLEEERRSFE